jgi:hypothetical protein
MLQPRDLGVFVNPSDKCFACNGETSIPHPHTHIVYDTLQAASGESIFPCDECSRVCSSLRERIGHLMNLHRVQHRVLCPLCGTFVSSREELEFHIVQVCDKIPCSICEHVVSTIEWPTHMFQHVYLHTAVNGTMVFDLRSGMEESKIDIVKLELETKVTPQSLNELWQTMKIIVSNVDATFDANSSDLCLVDKVRIWEDAVINGEVSIAIASRLTITAQIMYREATDPTFDPELYEPTEPMYSDIDDDDDDDALVSADWV